MATAASTRKPAAKKTAAKKPAETTEPDEGDLEHIIPEEQRLTVDGVECVVRRLKFNEFMALLRVLSNGLGPALSEVSIDLTDEESVAQDLSALMLLAVPNATVEFAAFLRTVVEPVDPRHEAKVATYIMNNPEVDVLFDVFEAVAIQEKDDLAVLAGKLQAMWKRVARVYTKK